MADKLWNAKYWSDRLKETDKDAAPFREKLWQIPAPDLTIEDSIKLRYILDEYASISRLLSEAMDEPDPEPVPFWKKLFRK